MKPEDILGFLGIEATNMDEFKAGFTGKYATEEQAKEKWLSPIVGQKFGKAKKNILNKFREEGIDFAQSEFDDKEIEEVALTLVNKTKSAYEAKMKELESKVGQGNEEMVKEWKEKADKAAQRAADNEKLLKSLSGEYDAFKQTASQQVKNVKGNYFKSNLFGKLPYKAGTDDLMKKGFTSHIEENFKFDFDDNDQPFVTDAKGERIRSQGKADTFMSPEEVLMAEAAKFKIIAENPQAGKTVPPPFAPTPFAQHPLAPAAPTTGTPQSGKRKVSPEMEKYL